MAAPKKNSPAPAAAEAPAEAPAPAAAPQPLPPHGGCWIRQPDGSLVLDEPEAAAQAEE